MSASRLETYDVVVVGGGPSGATAAEDLARAGRRVLLLDRAGRIKPCGGAIPPRLIKDFDIPDHLLVAKINAARMVAPSDRRIDMPIEGGFIGMVDREHFDEFLRDRAAKAGAIRRTGTFTRITRDHDDCAIVEFKAQMGTNETATMSERHRVRARIVIGADGANSSVAKQAIPGSDQKKLVFAYHEIVKSPADGKLRDFDAKRCDVIYNGRTSPDFYAWVFPHGETTSIGTGSANKGFSLRDAVGDLRDTLGLTEAQTVRREGAPIPLRPLKKWDNGRDVIVAGDAAGVVAPSSGEGIYYAMAAARFTAEVVNECLETGNPRALRLARKRFMKAHGTVFFVLGMMQYFWYSSDKRRERFVSMCEDKDVQKLTFDAYMNKELVRAKPMAHVRIFFKDLGHLMGLVKA
jgi:geranylgeranyl diphosphate/geranylgeranyl-bacteriochlorophyllide a reductase